MMMVASTLEARIRMKLSPLTDKRAAAVIVFPTSRTFSLKTFTEWIKTANTDTEARRVTLARDLIIMQNIGYKHDQFRNYSFEVRFYANSRLTHRDSQP